MSETPRVQAAPPFRVVVNTPGGGEFVLGWADSYTIESPERQLVLHMVTDCFGGETR